MMRKRTHAVGSRLLNLLSPLVRLLRLFPQFATYMNKKRLYKDCKESTFEKHYETCTSRTHLSIFASCPSMCARMLEAWCYKALNEDLIKKDLK